MGKRDRVAKNVEIGQHRQDHLHESRLVMILQYSEERGQVCGSEMCHLDAVCKESAVLDAIKRLHESPSPVIGLPECQVCFQGMDLGHYEVQTLLENGRVLSDCFTVPHC